MTANRTVEEKVADWGRAFAAVREELTDPKVREMIALVKSDDVASIQLGMTFSRFVMANDRMAALVAGILTTQGGVRVAPMADDDV